MDYNKVKNYDGPDGNRGRGRPKGTGDGKKRKQTRGSLWREPDFANNLVIDYIMDIMPRERLPEICPENEDIILPLVRDRLIHYLDMCKKHGKMINNQSMCYALGVTQEEMKYLIRKAPHSDFALTFKKIFAICAVQREEAMANGSLNPIVGIFWQKNFDGYTDQREVVHRQADPLGESATTRELERRYSDPTYTGSDGAGIEEDPLAGTLLGTTD